MGCGYIILLVPGSRYCRFHHTGPIHWARIGFGKRFSSTNLSLHDSLLEARSDHGLLARLLASSPSGGPVRGLHGTNALSHGGVLSQLAVPGAHGIGGGIGRRDIGLDDERVGVIGGHAVLRQTRDGRRVGAGDEARADRRQSRDAAAARHHGGQVEVPREGGWRGDWDWRRG